MRSTRSLVTLGLLGALVALPAAAQEAYPAKPVRILVGFVPGASADATARITAQILTDRFKQSFIVDNRPGANGLVAMQTVARSAPDGYTLLLATTGALTISPLVEKNLPYNPVTSFTPVALVAAFPYVLATRPDLPVNDVKGLVSYSKMNPGKLTFGSAGTLSVNQLGVEWLKALTGLDARHIPFKGGNAAMTDLMGGRIDFTLASAGSAMPQIAAGKLKGLAVTSPARNALAEGLPTMIESGIPGYVVQPWNGIIGPARLPKGIVTALNETINEGLRRPDIQSQLTKLILYPIADTPPAFERLIGRELATWGDIVKQANIQP